MNQRNRQGREHSHRECGGRGSHQRWIGFSEDDGNNRRRRRYPAAAPSRSRGTNALSRLRNAPARQAARRLQSPQKKSKKSLAMPMGIDTNGVILRAWEEKCEHLRHVGGAVYRIVCS
jgi:hypothetical protein